MLKTPDEWCRIKDIFIMDPDGWRKAGDPSWETPIAEDDFMTRMSISTIMKPRPAWAK